ncbi:MAG TPA: hypothetical protein VFI56_03335 [Vicinamibacterales bacterium]|nr:hypothetical protein [Vicinamibacterales bacterium]
MTRRIALSIFLLAAAPLPGVAAQSKPAATQPAAAAPAAGDERTAQDTRQRLREILEQYPPSVGQVLRLDPSLLSRQDYLALYPTLAAYLAQHPEVAHNPVFFIGAPNSGPSYIDNRSHAAEAIQNVFIGLEVLLGIVTAIITLAWLARAAIDHRRWLRATKIQTDAHNKIVDRLSSNEDLLAYMQSPTGQRFLTASFTAPAAGAPPVIVGAPFNRILWSVQAGIVLAAAGIGLLFAKSGVIEEVAEPMQVISILSIALGIGFIASAFASYAMSRQLGLIEPQVPHA